MSFWTDNINNRLLDHQQAITKHMLKHGVSHPGYRPWRYRDLYNGYRYYGSPFLNGLGSILGSIFGSKGFIYNNQGTAGNHPVYTQLGNAVSEGVDGGGNPPLPTSLPGVSYNGDDYSGFSGNDVRRDDRNRSHWWQRDAWNRMPILAPLMYAQPAYSTPWMLPTNVDPTQQDAPVLLPPPDDKIMGINKKLFFGIIIAAALFLYFKFRK